MPSKKSMTVDALEVVLAKALQQYRAGKMFEALYLILVSGGAIASRMVASGIISETFEKRFRKRKVPTRRGK